MEGYYKFLKSGRKLEKTDVCCVSVGIGRHKGSISYRYSSAVKNKEVSVERCVLQPVSLLLKNIDDAYNVHDNDECDGYEIYNIDDYDDVKPFIYVDDYNGFINFVFSDPGDYIDLPCKCKEIFYCKEIKKISQRNIGVMKDIFFALENVKKDLLGEEKEIEEIEDEYKENMDSLLNLINSSKNCLLSVCDSLLTICENLNKKKV